MSKLTSKKWWICTLERAIKTFAQAMVSMFTVGMAISEVDWINAISVSLVATILSVLTSIATIPEPE